MDISLAAHPATAEISAAMLLQGCLACNAAQLSMDWMTIIAIGTSHFQSHGWLSGSTAQSSLFTFTCKQVNS